MGLTYNPPVGDIKKCKVTATDENELRVGSWRIIYRHENEEIVEIIFVIDIGNRGYIYK